MASWLANYNKTLVGAVMSLNWCRRRGLVAEMIISNVKLNIHVDVLRTQQVDDPMKKKSQLMCTETEMAWFNTIPPKVLGNTVTFMLY